MEGLRRYMWYVLLLLLAGLLCMFSAYALVRYITRDIDMVQAVDPLELRVARQLRTTANELTTLANQFFEQLPIEAEHPPKPEVVDWIALDFLERLRTFLSKIRPDEDCPLLVQTVDRACWSDLVCAVERLHNLALHPRDIAVRRVVAQEILYTVGLLEEEIKTISLARRLEISPVAATYLTDTTD